MDRVDVSDRLWRLTLEHSPVGMAIVSTDGRFIGVNGALCAMLGRDAADLRALTFQEITHLDDLALDLELLDEMLTGERASYRMVKRYFHGDGHIVWGDLSVALLRDDDGKPIHLISQIVDVTQHHHDRALLVDAQTRIDQQRRRAEAVFDTVDVGLILIDADGRYESINRHHADFMRLGFPDGHAGWAGQLGEVYGEDGHTPMTREEMPTLRAAQEEEFADVRIWVGAPGGVRRALSVSARSVRDGEGRFTGAALVYKDVTDYLEAMAVKDEFLASVSHELRTPLTSVLGHLEIARSHPDLPSDLASRLEVVERNAQRLHGLVADLLEVAGQHEGAPSIEREPTDLTALAEQAVEAIRPAARAAGLTVETDLGAAVRSEADPGRIRQVLDNLLSNAVKYSEPGGRVRLALNATGSEAVLTVADDGLGIAPDELDRLFMRFFRGSEAQERQIPGTGLGLVIVRSIVDAHGGTIDLTSDVGVGTTATVRLPV